MSDFIAKYGIFSGIGGVILAAAATWIIGRVRQQRARRVQTLPLDPLDAEVIPLWFQISLNQSIPDVRVYVQVVNYSKRELQVSDVTATYLRPDEGPAFENIPGGEYRIPPRRSWQVTCRAPSWTPKPRRCRRSRGRTRSALDWKCACARRREEAGVCLLGGLVIRGWISGLPSHPALQRGPKD